jgi:hypothetical protein
MCLHRAKALVMGLIRLMQGRQARLPLAQRLVLCVRDIPQVGFGYPRHGIRWRHGRKPGQGVVTTPMFLRVPRVNMTKRLDRETVRAVGVVPGLVKDKRPESFRATVTKKTPMPESR